MTSNTQYTAYDITSEEYDIGEYILYKNKPYVIKSFNSSGKAILEESYSVKTSEFTKEENNIGDIVYLDEVPYRITSFSGGKATLEYQEVNIIDITNETQKQINTVSSVNIDTSMNYVYTPTETINKIDNIYDNSKYYNTDDPEARRAIDFLIELQKQMDFQGESINVFESYANSVANNINDTNNKESFIVSPEILDIKEKLKNEENKKDAEEKIVKEEQVIIATDSYIYTYKDERVEEVLNKIASKSSISTNSNIKTDNYGNKIDNNIEDWIGEDYIQEKKIPKANAEEVIKKEEKDEYIDGFGKLMISIGDLDTFRKANIDLTILDKNYNLHTLHLFYKNDYVEKLDIAVGKYRVYSITYADSDKVNEMYTKDKDFVINGNETTELKIFHTKEKLEELKEEGIVVKEDINIKKESKGIPKIFTVLLFIIFILVAAFMIIKKIKKSRS